MRHVMASKHYNDDDYVGCLCFCKKCWDASGTNSSDSFDPAHNYCVCDECPCRVIEAKRNGSID